MIYISKAHHRHGLDVLVHVRGRGHGHGRVRVRDLDVLNARVHVRGHDRFHDDRSEYRLFHLHRFHLNVNRVKFHSNVHVGLNGDHRDGRDRHRGDHRDGHRGVHPRVHHDVSHCRLVLILCLVLQKLYYWRLRLRERPHYLKLFLIIKIK